MPQEKGQLSIEILMLMAVFSIALVSAAAILIQVHERAEVQMDIKAGEIFLSQIEAKTKQLNLLGNGSSFTIKMTPVRDWKVSANGEELEIELAPLKFFEHEMPTLKANLAAELEAPDSPFEVEGTAVFELKKEAGRIIFSQK